jgi:hypothetical protein
MVEHDDALNFGADGQGGRVAWPSLDRNESARPA